MERGLLFVMPYSLALLSTKWKWKPWTVMGDVPFGTCRNTWGGLVILTCGGPDAAVATLCLSAYDLSCSTNECCCQHITEVGLNCIQEGVDWNFTTNDIRGLGMRLNGWMEFVKTSTWAICCCVSFPCFASSPSWLMLAMSS